MEMDVSVSNALFFYQGVDAETSLILDSYGSLERANIYFDNRLRAELWHDADLKSKRAALAEATRLIDKLNFAGDKADDSQNHQFPRGTDTRIPDAIEQACYEVSLKLIEGYDPDLEVANLGFHQQNFSTVRSTYDRTFVLEHLREGIPSARAWDLIKPFLRMPGQVLLRRVN